ncbi:hypothetical protein FB45DRAFT_1067907 [Roridomyces roridus]|uniref:Uncharacterized protein n=1 Tax=Roridomyces roridus TaxID=1738132 RepID=A0AAD7B1J6_9AGAR|nr:hypothetical protein FB45DRAFT_1067907 [Roridomyces roridus]
MPNVIAHTGIRDIRDGRGDIYTFWSWSYRRLLVVQAIGLTVEDAKTRDLHLEKIQSCIDSIDFEHEDGWAYLVDKPTGPRIIHKPRKVYQIPCDFLWAPRVDVSEIDMQKIHHGKGRAIWRGKEVDVHIGCDDVELTVIEDETRALKATMGMDVTYGIVGHIFRGEKLVGVMRESSRASRTVGLADRAAVYAAFALLETAFILHTHILDIQSIAMSETGRVRMLDIHTFKYYRRNEREKLEQDAQKYHWGPLKELFDILTECVGCPIGLPGYFFFPTSTILASTPSPDTFMLISLWLTFDTCVQFDEEKKRRRRKVGSKTSLEVRTARSKGHTHAPVKATRTLDYHDPPARLGSSRGRSAELRVLLAPEDERVDGGGFIVEEDERGGLIFKEEDRVEAR